jgi:predicted metal-dependent TIM-barrel fold hydrolase
MPFIDAHTHSYLRGPEDLESMALSGVEALVVCAFLPVQPSDSSGLIDLFRWLDTVERARLADHGLAMRCRYPIW